MKSKVLFILVLALLLNLSYAKRTAMLVGVQNYKAFASLEACHGDVDAMKELLEQGGFEDDHIWALKDASYGEMLTASDLFSNVTAFARGIQKGDEVVFFFSGHGIGGSDGKNYLLGADGNIDNPEKYGSISVEDIKQILKEKSPSEVVLIVDACRNFVKKEGKGTGEKISAKMNTGKGIKVSSTIGTEPVTPSEKSDKTIVKTIYAASEGQQSFERKDKNKGAFTYYMTYLLDSPNSAMDIDMSKDGVITIEDLVQFADNRLGDYTRSQGLPSMNPVYQTEGGITYEPFMLFRYNAEKVVQEQKKEGAKPIFQYDEKAELEKIKKFTENKEYLKEELPVYQPKVVQDKTIKVDDTDLSSWKLAMAQEDEINKAKAEEQRKATEAKDKEKIFNELKSKYNTVIADLDKTEDIFAKHEKLENLRDEVNASKYPEVKQKILPLLEPVYQKIKESKGQKQAELETLKPQFEKDIKDMEEMQTSSLSDELKEKYLDGFKKKWADYARIQKDLNLARKYKMLFIPKTLGEMIYVEGGTFQMCDTKSDKKPMHNVTLSDFYIGKTEITQAQYQAVMGENPSRFKADNLPVESVTWNDAVEFCRKLSQKDGVTYRLPTEAEWEYAARGGSISRGYEYSGSVNIEEVTWYTSNSGRTTHPVAAKKPNELGIYDMSGNVWEWCSDWNGDYPNGAQTNPTGTSSGSYHVLRGGGWDFDAYYCKVAFRPGTGSPAYSNFDGIGFRVIRRVE
ncbi:MAG: SUMF1/EgtB/PvdO family nonheme iron enzyme [Candidatus Delongbacteria bacterium]|nr:SUMF1/EgtB/PvdO family nonheme iron enzyme [Candidatus Delongbacteria bacterium]MCG2760175.1 SUMF1/EgtB/PvdO family nonheme iron enzyme [Candidatus Delongbacteria bacterium]